jgi:hypothetical protein
MNDFYGKKAKKYKLKYLKLKQELEGGLGELVVRNQDMESIGRLLQKGCNPATYKAIMDLYEQIYRKQNYEYIEPLLEQVQVEQIPTEQVPLEQPLENQLETLAYEIFNIFENLNKNMQKSDIIYYLKIIFIKHKILSLYNYSVANGITDKQTDLTNEFGTINELIKILFELIDTQNTKDTNNIKKHTNELDSKILNTFNNLKKIQNYFVAKILSPNSKQYNILDTEKIHIDEFAILIFKKIKIDNIISSLRKINIHNIRRGADLVELEQKLKINYEDAKNILISITSTKQNTNDDIKTFKKKIENIDIDLKALQYYIDKYNKKNNKS